MAQHCGNNYISFRRDKELSHQTDRQQLSHESTENNACDYVLVGRTSTETYRSSEESLEEADRSKESRIEVVDDRYGHPPEALASNPPRFGRLFPSTRRLLIQHDDTTVDGKMNLRVDTLVLEAHRRQREMILFHLRMHDLRDRKFSLRRYCRDSGREVCHSSIKFHQSVTRSRPLSTAFSALRSHSDANSSTTQSLKRLDSGFRLLAESENPCRDQPKDFNEYLPDKQSPIPTNIIQLDFSNYARVDVKRQGSGGFRHYDFEYWNANYQWRKTAQKYGTSEKISYHLYQSGKPKPIAHIVPERLTSQQACEEGSKGGWVPISSMWISDPSVYEKMSDVADVIVATGLTAMVDDCIQHKWHDTRSSRSVSPLLSPLLKSVDYLASTKIIGRLFARSRSTNFRRSRFFYRAFGGG